MKKRRTGSLVEAGVLERIAALVVAHRREDRLADPAGRRREHRLTLGAAGLLGLSPEGCGLGRLRG